MEQIDVKIEIKSTRDIDDENLQAEIEKTLIMRLKAIDDLCREALPEWIIASIESAKDNFSNMATMNWIIKNLGYDIKVEKVGPLKEIISFTQDKTIMKQIEFEYEIDGVNDIDFTGVFGR
jgi:hypothetical protein